MNAKYCRKGTTERRLGCPWHAFKQHMTTGDECHEHLICDIVQTDNDLFDRVEGSLTQFVDTKSQLIRIRCSHKAHFQYVSFRIPATTAPTTTPIKICVSVIVWPFIK